MGMYRHVDKILDYNELFKSRQEIEEIMGRILDAMERGNWVRARYDARIFSHRLERTIEDIRKSDPDLENPAASKKLPKRQPKKPRNKETQLSCDEI